MAIVKGCGLPVHESFLIVAKRTRLDLFDRDDDGVPSCDGLPAHRAQDHFAFHVLEPPLLVAAPIAAEAGIPGWDTRL